MNAFIAFSVVFSVLGIMFALIANFFKILFFGDFKLDKNWYQFSPSFNDIKAEWQKQGKGRKKLLFKFFYLIFFWLGNIFFVFGFVLFAVNFLKG